MVMITGVLLLLTFVFLALYAIRIYNQLLAIKSDSFSDLLVLKQHLLRRYSQIRKILSQLQSFSGVDKDILESAHRQRQEAKNHLNNFF